MTHASKLDVHSPYTLNQASARRFGVMLALLAAGTTAGCINKGDTNVTSGVTKPEKDDEANAADADETSAEDESADDTEATAEEDAQDASNDSSEEADLAECGLDTGGEPKVVQLALGFAHSCARMSNGTVRCWSDGGMHLGNDTTAGSRVPVQVESLTGIVDLAAGQHNTCAVDCWGKAVCWGGGGWGQLGNGDIKDSLKPVAVELPGAVRRIFVGKSASSCAILQEEYEVYCWGSNFAGALGNGSESGGVCASGANNCVSTPTKVVSDYWKDTRFLALGSQFGCGVAGDNSVLCWGAGSAGQLGDNGLINQLKADGISTAPHYATLSGGKAFACGADVIDGTDKGWAWCWGANNLGQLGRGTRNDDANPDYEKAGDLEQVVSIAAGASHVCALRQDGHVYCWGLNTLGQLGLGNASGELDDFGQPYVPTPTAVPGLNNVVEIAAGESHTCARDEQGDVYCWGNNSSAQIGDGTHSGEACADGGEYCRLSPTKVIGW